MKNNIIIAVALLALYACKKESNNPSVAGGASLSNGGNILIAHKWKQTHDYRDTTVYASNYLNQLPLSTTEDFSSPYDTCSSTSKVWFKTGGIFVTIKGQKCLASEPDTSSNYTWTLSNNDTKFIMNGTLFDVLELTPTKFKIGLTLVDKDSNNVILSRETVVQILEPAP